MRNWNDPSINWKDPKIIDEWEFGDDGQCHDCGAVRGQPHDGGCDMERCIDCGGQAISCECNYLDEETAPPSFSKSDGASGRRSRVVEGV